MFLEKNKTTETMKRSFFISCLLALTSFSITSFISLQNEDNKMLSHIVDLEKQHLAFYWKDDNNNNLYNFKNLKKWLIQKDEKLIFATNGGMYLKNRSPQGLFIQNGVVKTPINTIQEAYGNFYMQPNGVFYITNDNKGYITTSLNFVEENVKFATQSGPMLVIDDKIHSKFRNGSKNLNIRNGVGVLPNGNLLFAMSKQEINLYDFATYFKKQGCKNALYLDGFVSRTYLPKKNWNSINGSFGVMIGETEKIKN